MATNNAVEQWQQWMLNSLIHPNQVDKQTVETQFTASANLSAQQCLGIYQRGYILRLTQCLVEQFPALSHALGRELFEQFAKKYLQEYPSDSYTLYELGRRFAEFLTNDRPDKALPPEERESWIDFMIDLAQYERLHFSLFDAPGHEGKPWPDLTVPDSQLTLQPCFALANYNYPVGWYYHAIKEKRETPFPSKQKSYVVLLRTNFYVTTFPISEIHYYFLQHINTHNDITKALQHISDRTKTPLARVIKSWKNEVRDKWLTSGFFIQKNT